MSLVSIYFCKFIRRNVLVYFGGPLASDAAASCVPFAAPTAAGVAGEVLTLEVKSGTVTIDSRYERIGWS